MRLTASDLVLAAAVTFTALTASAAVINHKSAPPPIAATQTPTPQTIYTFKLTLAQVQVIGNALTTLSYKDAAPVLSVLQTQLNTQLPATPPAAPPAKKP